MIQSLAYRLVLLDERTGKNLDGVWDRTPNKIRVCYVVVALEKNHLIHHGCSLVFCSASSSSRFIRSSAAACSSTIASCATASAGVTVGVSALACGVSESKSSTWACASGSSPVAATSPGSRDAQRFHQPRLGRDAERGEGLK